MQHEISAFPMSLGDPYEYCISSAPNKDWSFGEFELGTTTILENIDQEERELLGGFPSPSQPSQIMVEQGSEAAATENMFDSERAPLSDKPWYHVNVDIDQILYPMSDPFLFEKPALNEDKPTKPTLALPLEQVKEDKPIKKATSKKQEQKKQKQEKQEKKEEEEEEEAKKQISKKRALEQEKEKEEEERESSVDSDYEFSTDGPRVKLSRKEKNKLAARKYRAKQRDEADDVSKRCNTLVTENAQLKGEIETTRKQIEEYKKLLSQFAS